MRAHNVIIISSGRGHLAPTRALDHLILAVVGLKKNPILVLGPDGDDLIRGCEEIEHCDLVFDPNFSGNLFSSIKAGLHATIGAAFVIPLSEKVPDAQVWTELEKALGPNGISQECDIVRPITRLDDTQSDHLPFLVTARGVSSLKDLSAFTEWEASEQIAVSLTHVPERST